MHLPLRARRAVTALLVFAALLFAANTAAWAGDEDDGTKTATVVVTSDGTKTVRLVQGKDGEFIIEPEHADGAAPRMRVMVRKGAEDGDVRVLEMKDGKWVSSGEPAQVEHEVFVHHGPATTTTFGHAAEGRNPMSTVMRWVMTDGMAGELPNDPLKGWFEGGSDVPMAGLRNALKADGWNAQSLQAWFLQHLMGGMAALHTQAQAPAPHAAHPPMHPQMHPQMHPRMHGQMQGPMRGRWFEIGRGYGPCDSCGCDCASQSRMQRRHPGRTWHGSRQGRGNGRGHGRRQARRGGCDCEQRRHATRGCDGGCGSCDKRGSCGSSKGHCGSCDKRGSCGSSKGNCGSCDKRGSCDKQGSCGSCKSSCGSCDKQGSCGGDCGQKPARRQAYMLWNDGSGWKHRKVDGQGPVAHWGHVHDAEKGMTFLGEDSDATPDFARLLREVIGESHSAPGSAHIVVESLDLLPADLLERVPPSVLEGVMKELQGLGLGELLAPAKSACDDCPKKGACKGGDCDKGTSEKPASCCGTCKGECKDCPKARDGSCAGNCEDCPNKKGAEKKECCGTCQGGAAK